MPTDPRPASDWLTPADHPHHPAVHAWQAHLDARRLGANPPTPPEVAQNRAATDALFRAIAVDRHRAARRAAWECRA